MKKSTMSLREAMQLNEQLDEQPLDTLVEMKGVFNSAKTKLADKEKNVDKAIKAKSTTSSPQKFEQLDFGDITFEPELTEEPTLKVTSKKSTSDLATEFLNAGYNSFVKTTLNKDKILKDYSTLPSSLQSHFTIDKAMSFNPKRSKKGGK